MNALELFRPERLDLAVKARFFQSIATGEDLALNDRIYRWHIEKRNRGVEPPAELGGPSLKYTVDDFVESCYSLLASLRDKGFDPACAVPVNLHGQLLAGAHRTAASHVLGLDVPTIQHDRKPPTPWGMSWFLENKCPRDDLARILYTVALQHLGNCTIFVFWGPAIDHWNAMVSQLQPEFQPMGYVDWEFLPEESAGFESLIYDIYSEPKADLVKILGGIQRKVANLAGFRQILRVVVAKGPSEAARPVKERLRELVTTVPQDQFITCHSGSSKGEVLNLAGVLLNPVGIKHAKMRKRARPSTRFVQWLVEAREVLLKQKLVLTDVCMVGSGVLEAAGIRDATDIDLTVQSKERDRFGRSASGVSPHVDIVSEGYHRTKGGGIKDDVLIRSPEHHTMFLGFKLATLKIIHDRKFYSKRPKDRLDLELMGELWR